MTGWSWGAYEQAHGPRPYRRRSSVPSSDRITRSQRIILDTLQQHAGRWVPIDALVDALYGDDPDGGPLQADNVVRANIGYLRRKTSPGRIWTRHGFGYAWTADGAPCPDATLTPTEERLLDLLSSREIATHRALTFVLLNSEGDSAYRTVKVFICRIRRKRPDLVIENVFGVGYRLSRAERRIAA